MPFSKDNPPTSRIASIIDPFISSYWAPIFLLLALGLGALAIMVTPREEEPQIVVPMADVIVEAPGSSPQEVEKLVSTRLEKRLWQVEGVEYVYSRSERGRAVVTVRFFVGEDLEDALVRLHNQIIMHEDQVPPIVQDWIVKPISIDDVPILNLTLYSGQRSSFELRRMGEELLARLSEVENVSDSEIFGGRPREVRVEMDPQRMAGRSISPLQIYSALEKGDFSRTLGDYPRHNRELQVLGDAHFSSARELSGLVVGTHQGQPVYLQDVAEIRDGPAEPEAYTRLGFSREYRSNAEGQELSFPVPAVTLALAKKKGTNAVRVADDLLERLEELKPDLLPDDVYVETTRNYGQTAQEKVNELFRSLAFAVSTVVVILALTLGWRPALVVGLAIPVSFSLALFSSYLLGFTINRVTLFALILSLGLVVDDPITNVDNVKRHTLLGHKDTRTAIQSGVSEVIVPVAMSTLAIIACFLPLFFITGMMGPYMAPMAANVPLTVIFSTLCAVTIVPWLCNKFLSRRASPPAKAGVSEQGVPDWILRGYRRLLHPLLVFKWKRRALFALVALLLLSAMALALFRMVPLKMLPFDDKDEFQIVLDMPEGTSLEQTDALLREFESHLQEVPEVTSFVSYTGHASPMDFNAMVRQYYARSESHQGDIRINLVPSGQRDKSSHAVVLSLRRDLEEIAQEYGADMQLVEVPPGPPVMSTIVAEVYADPDRSYREQIQAAGQVREIMEQEPWVRDVDVSSEAERERIEYVLDREKAALHGLDAQEVLRSLRLFLDGAEPAAVHTPWERETLSIRMILPLEKRSGVHNLEQLSLVTEEGNRISLGELGEFRRTLHEQPIVHKNLRQVVYVTAEMAGQPPGEAVLDMKSRLQEDPLPQGFEVQWRGEGEWKITLDVFRDLGLAFAFALVAIYLLLVVQTRVLGLPLLIMSAIPLSLLGIMPGFFLLNLVAAQEVDGFRDPIFFTATAMIGMIALGGIVIRNSLVLVEFIRSTLNKGENFQEAVLQSGAVRLRPIVLTAVTTALGVWPITLDPVFSGLAWALIFGLMASTVFTLILIPVAYYVLYGPDTD